MQPERALSAPVTEQLTETLERRREGALAQLAQRHLEFERVQLEAQAAVNAAYERFRAAQSAVVDASRELMAIAKLLAGAARR